MNWAYFGLDVTGDKIFVAEVYGPIHVYDAATGNPVIQLIPGPEISARAGWDDVVVGVSAVKRSSGEYVITKEEAGADAFDLLYRWTPSADTAIAVSPTTLTATVRGRKIVLTWTGPMGAVTSYNLYRSTVSGAEVLYQTGIKSPIYTDLNVNPGTTYYYKVTAVNAVGESAPSNEISASTVTGQAEFVKTDAATQGNWYTGTIPSATYIYGKDGYEICNYATSYPSYATVSAPGSAADTWVGSSTDARALRKPTTGTTDRIASYRATASGGVTPWSWDINLTDGKWHQVAIYLLDWTSNHWFQQIQVLDQATGTVLYTRTMLAQPPVADLAFNNGEYLVFNISGHVKIQVSNTNAFISPIASALFFDPVATPAPALGWWKLNETSGSTAADSSGLGQTMAASAGTWDPVGMVNGCLNLWGSPYQSYVNLPIYNMFYTSGDRTFATWIKTSTSGPIVGTQQSVPGPAPTQYVPILYVGNDGKLYGTFNNNPSSPMVSSASVNDGNWHHVAIVRCSNSQTLYLDGVVVSTQVGAITGNSIMCYGGLGNAYTTGWPHLAGGQMYSAGRFDDVRCYDRALGVPEIWTLAHP